MRLQDTLKGFRFKDNKSKYRWEDGKNGIAQFNFDSFLPPSMTVCMRGKIDYMRHGDYQYWFVVDIKRREPRIGTVPIDFSFFHTSKPALIVESMAIAPHIAVTMNKEEQDKAKEAKAGPP